MIQIYGIKNCDTVKKTLRALDNGHIPYTFIDLKQQTPDKDILQNWCDLVGVDTLINTRGTTWRKLSDMDKKNAKYTPIPYIQQNTLLLKRPVIVYTDGEVTVGFNTAVQQKLGLKS